MRGACSILSSSRDNLVLSGIGQMVNGAIPFSKGTFLEVVVRSLLFG